MNFNLEEVEKIDLTKEGQAVDALVVRAQQLAVIDQQTYDLAMGEAKQVKDQLKKLEKERDNFIEPNKEAIKRIKDKFNPFIEKLERVIDGYRSNMNKFTNEQARKAEELRLKLQAEEEKKARERAERLAQIALDAEKAGNTETANFAMQQAIETQPVVITKVPTFAKAKGTREYTDWVVEVEDINAIPREFLIPDMSKIKATIKGNDGGVTIPGIKFSKVTKTSI